MNFSYGSGFGSYPGGGFGGPPPPPPGFYHPSYSGPAAFPPVTIGSSEHANLTRGSRFASQHYNHTPRNIRAARRNIQRHAAGHAGLPLSEVSVEHAPSGFYIKGRSTSGHNSKFSAHTPLAPGESGGLAGSHHFKSTNSFTGANSSLAVVHGHTSRTGMPNFTDYKTLVPKRGSKIQTALPVPAGSGREHLAVSFSRGFTNWARNNPSYVARQTPGNPHFLPKASYHGGYSRKNKKTNKLRKSKTTRKYKK